MPQISPMNMMMMYLISMMNLYMKNSKKNKMFKKSKKIKMW